MGIPEEIRSRIFDPFFTTKEVGKGTGLGLSVCLGIVSEHHGKLTMESRDGNGAEFTVELPIVSGETAPAQAGSTTGILLSSGRLLAVDDEYEVRSYLSSLLASRGFTVDVAHDGQKALNFFKSREYDVVLLDIRMPGMNGMELYQHMKSIDSEIGKKTIFITGDAFTPYIRESIERLNIRVITKPFAQDDLVAAIDRIVHPSILAEPAEANSGKYGT
jgi:CheY-like chemotaxis protein